MHRSHDVRAARGALVLSALLACAGPTEPGGGVEIRLGAGSVTRPARGMAEVPYAVVNTGPATVDLTSRCGGRLSPVVERRHGGAWSQYAGGVCPAVLPTSPVPLGAGERRSEVVAVGEAGEYRLVLGTDRGSVTSAAFVVR